MRKLGSQAGALVLTAGVAMGLWAAWLGWDQRYDEHPDGTVSGPYEAWQVVGLVLTLLAPVVLAALRGYAVGAVIGTSAGLTAAAFIDWSDDESGLFMVGVILVMVGSLVGTLVVSAIAQAAGPSAERRQPHGVR
ncbi:hypothetical protein [Streptomyces boninensis]|uniref:hypothetical protein n=1 Tax=Streptomyces boninensis TaxID=2039455 RepID=UPI003B2249E4